MVSPLRRICALQLANHVLVQSLRIAPAATHPTQTSNTSSHSAPSAPGLHDTLRSKLSLQDKSSSASGNVPLQSTHPLESRLRHWQTTQDNLKMNMLRRNFGIGEPVRRGMEARICQEGEWRPGMLGGSARVGGEVLGGRDTEITWEDVYGGDETREGRGFHDEMEARQAMSDW